MLKLSRCAAGLSVARRFNDLLIGFGNNQHRAADKKLKSVQYLAPGRRRPRLCVPRLHIFNYAAAPWRWCGTVSPRASHCRRPWTGRDWLGQSGHARTWRCCCPSGGPGWDGGRWLAVETPQGNGLMKRRGSISTGGMGVFLFSSGTQQNWKTFFLLLFCPCFSSSASKVDRRTRRGLKLECVTEKRLLTWFTKHVGAQRPGGWSALKTVNREADGCSLCVVQWSHTAVRSNVPKTASVLSLSHYVMLCTRWNTDRTNDIHFICLRPQELIAWVRAKHRQWKMTWLFI